MSEEKKIPVSSKELYEAYKAWRDQDVDDGSTYARSKRIYGLCSWVAWGAPNCSKDLNPELDAQFLAHNLGEYSSTPFGECYPARHKEHTQHLNPARVKWVDDRIADYEKANGL